MENQHRHIIGYRELSQNEIDLMNNVKALGAQIEGLLEMLAQLPECDKRWLSIGRTDLQTGLMALTRAIARPASF